MGRIVSIDYGTKRTGLATTDPLQIIATALATIQTKNIYNYLQKYIQSEEVELIVVGHPKQMDNTDSDSFQHIKGFIKKINKLFPEIPVELYDERFTSKIAEKAILQAGVKKKKRQDKGLVDSVAAVIILQSYLSSKAMIN